MSLPVAPLAATRFALHPAARVLAGAQVVAPNATSARMIPTAPLENTLGALLHRVAHSAPFCISTQTPPALGSLRDDQFATLTGGSAGAPKVIARSQASWTACFAVTADHFRVGPGTGVAILGDLTHSLALYGAVEAMHLGATLHALSDLGPRAQLAHLQRGGIQILYATPTQLRLLAASDAAAALTDVRVILCGGGALDPVTDAAVRILCPNATLHVFYGAAETSFITLSDATTPQGSVGRAYPGVEIAITAGDIRVRSPYLFDRYLQGDSRHTRWHDDWLSLGESGWMDEAGNLYLRGRAGRMITVADRNVFLDELTAHLAPLVHPRHIAVVARPDRLRGQRPAILLSGVRDDELTAALATACRGACGTSAVNISFIDPFPLLSSGKPDLMTLEDTL